MKRLKIILSGHALYQIKDRKLSITKVKQTVTNPDNISRQADGRLLAYKFLKKTGKNYLLIVIFEQTNSTIKVISPFLTSKLHKYL